MLFFDIVYKTHVYACFPLLALYHITIFTLLRKIKANKNKQWEGILPQI